MRTIVAIVPSRVTETDEKSAARHGTHALRHNLRGLDAVDAEAQASPPRSHSRVTITELSLFPGYKFLHSQHTENFEASWITHRHQRLMASPSVISNCPLSRLF